MPLIELRDAGKVYDLGEVKVDALHGASLSIERGEYLALIGPSGSGKSTLMNILGCLDQPTSGSYKLDGQEVSELTRDAHHVPPTRAAGGAVVQARAGGTANVHDRKLATSSGFAHSSKSSET